jgi:hypothetical protein
MTASSRSIASVPSGSISKPYSIAVGVFGAMTITKVDPIDVRFLPHCRQSCLRIAAASNALAGRLEQAQKALVGWRYLGVVQAERVDEVLRSSTLVAG